MARRSETGITNPVLPQRRWIILVSLHWVRVIARALLSVTQPSWGTAVSPIRCMPNSEPTLFSNFSETMATSMYNGW